MNQQIYYFQDDGNIPNNRLPVILYKKVIDHEDCSDWFEQTFQANGWSNNWRDIILPYDHFHSNTHEVLGLAWGEVSLKIGGKNGQIFQLQTGDVILIPAGVGHYSISEHTDYQFVGGYPNGNAWDLQTGLADEERSKIVRNIQAVETPDLDPIFGKKSLMIDKWI